MNFHREAIREAAARLRQQDITIVAQKAKGAAEGYAHGCEEVADLRRRLKIAEDALERSPCGEVYQLGLVDDDGNVYNGIAIKFDEAEGLKLPPVGHGDRFVVVQYSAIATIRDEGGEK